MCEPEFVEFDDSVQELLSEYKNILYTERAFPRERELIEVFVHELKYKSESSAGYIRFCWELYLYNRRNE